MGAGASAAESDTEHNDEHHHDPPFIKKYVFSF